MILLFTRKNTIFSKLIRLFTGEEISHFVLYFPETEIVFHSFRRGVEIDWYQRFIKGYEVVYSLKVLNIGKAQESIFYRNIIQKYLGKPYDILALLFMAVVIVARRVFNFRYKKNLWARESAFMCTELVNAIKELGIIRDVDWPDNLDMITPKELFDLLNQSGDTLEI